jgi:cellulose synthase/poly-beta-1,6-N-acetylglucosamine synthase-like glycosyltransferase
MNALDIVYIVLYWINMVMVLTVMIGFFPQMIFYLFFFIRRRHWKPAKTLHEIAILIPAHNEADSITQVVSFLANEMDYPKEKYKIYVVAHNCKDNTAELAEKAGATVFTLNDPDPKHAKPAYPLAYGFQQILKVNKTAELFIRFDADTIPCRSFFKEMNNSFDGGALIIRAYQAASNLKQNIWTKECALFFTKDSRIQNNFRQFVHSTTMATGPGLSIARSVIERINGWDCWSGCEDAEFGWKRMFEGYKCEFNTDAIVYSDQPSSYNDTKVRLVRLGHTTTKLFFTDGWRMLVAFLRTGNPMYLDMWIQLMFNPISVMCFTWFPLYYASWAILMLCQMNGIQLFSLGYFNYLNDVGVACHWIYFGADYFHLSAFFHLLKVDATTLSGAAQLATLGGNAFWSLIDMAWQVIVEMAVWCIAQSWICLLLDNKKLGLGWKLKDMWSAILLSPFYSFVYGVCNCLGAITRPHWVMAKRNPSETVLLEPLPENKDHWKYYQLTAWEHKHLRGTWWGHKAK